MIEATMSFDSVLETVVGALDRVFMVWLGLMLAWFGLWFGVIGVSNVIIAYFVIFFNPITWRTLIAIYLARENLFMAYHMAKMRFGVMKDKKNPNRRKNGA